MSELETLRQQRDELNRRIAELEAAEKAAYLKQVQELMYKGGLSAADVMAAAKKPKGAAPTKGGTLPPKYKNPATGETWAGRGAKPKWLEEALSKGQTLDSFAVTAAA